MTIKTPIGLYAFFAGGCLIICVEEIAKGSWWALFTGLLFVSNLGIWWAENQKLMEVPK